MIPVEIVDRQGYDLIGLYHGDGNGGDLVEAEPGEPWEPGHH
jgi:hypothetical protein